MKFTLNDLQQAVVDCQGGALLVLAPAGSGKTALLAARVAKALHHGMAPREILCLTFTNLAARQLKSRIEQDCPAVAGELWLSTFHGFCASLLRLESEQAGLPCDFTICDEEDAEALVAQLMKEKGLMTVANPLARDPRKPYMTPGDVIGLFDLARSTATGEALRLEWAAGQALPEPWRTLFLLYAGELRKRHTLDFSDLIYQARALFARRPQVRSKWSTRFSFIQVDEIQDTHLAEYDVIRILATPGNVAVYGDLDQSIYGWRGAEPIRVRDRFTVDFKPAVFGLPVNYRATATLIQAADAFAGQAFAQRHTRLIPAASCATGVKVTSHNAETEEEEAEWIADRIRRHVGVDGCRFRNTAVLCRTNKKAAQVGSIMSAAGIPCLVADQYNFFRRQEIKDAVAAVRILLDPHDLSAAIRLALRHLPGVGAITVEQIMAEGAEAGVRVNDFLDEDGLFAGEPCGQLLSAYDSGRIAVVDTESTGLSTMEDWIVEAACCRLDKGQVSGEWSSLVRSPKPVGQSRHVHGISDEMLARDGVAPLEALGRLLKELSGALVVGHNVGYDLALLQEEADRLGLAVPPMATADTFALARRFLKAESFRLGDLCGALGVPEGTAHRALGDVQSTVGLLHKLVPLLRAGAPVRRGLMARHGSKFRSAAGAIARWRDRMCRERPAAVLEGLLSELGIRNHYRVDPVRSRNLDRLVGMFRERDEPGWPARTALRNLVQFATLGKHLDVLSGKDDQVIVAPIHQSKGMEFDVVFIAGAVEGLIPIYRASCPEEEKRLFYVAMTRPRKALYVTGARLVTTAGGAMFEKSMTPYLKLIPEKWVESG